MHSLESRFREWKFMKKKLSKTMPKTKKQEPIVEEETPKKLDPEEQKEVRVIERIIENREIAPQDAFGKLTKSQVTLIKNTVAKGSSDDELRLFVQVCKGANLNPFLRQAHLVPFWDSKEGVERRAIIVGIDGFRAVAESSGAYAGNDDPIHEGENEIEIEVWGDDKKKHPKKLGTPVKSTVTVYKIVGGQRYPFTATARWDEYYPGAKKGNQWHKMPYMMLGKCAEALALRKAFPKLLSGMYAAEEMDKTVQVDAPEQKTATGLQTLTTMIATADRKSLGEYKIRMSESEKYTDAQKKEFLTAVDKRIAELDAESVK